MTEKTEIIAKQNTAELMRYCTERRIDLLNTQHVYLAEIVYSVASSAASCEDYAAWSGSRSLHFNNMIDHLKSFIDGYVLSSNPPKDVLCKLKYYDIIHELHLANDPEYQEYLRLKSKFGNINE